MTFLEDISPHIAFYNRILRYYFVKTTGIFEEKKEKGRKQTTQTTSKQTTNQKKQKKNNKNNKNKLQTNKTKKTSLFTTEAPIQCPLSNIQLVRFQSLRHRNFPVNGFNRDHLFEKEDEEDDCQMERRKTGRKTRTNSASQSSYRITGGEQL